MNSYLNFLYIYLALLSLVPICYSQGGVPLTEPKLVSITPIGSSTLNVIWQFAAPIYDQSDLIRVVIDFYEFYFYNYGPVNTSVSYTFTSTNKTITSLTRNFELVNGFYYVCFSSNSTRTNQTSFLFRKTCQLKRTCLRINSTICPQMTFTIISSSDISANSFTITVYWLKNLPYTQNTTTVQLINNGVIGTALSTTENSTYYIRPYRFTGLQSQTSYTVNITVSYNIFAKSMADTMNYLVTTSRSSNLCDTSDTKTFILWSVLLAFLFS